MSFRECLVHSNRGEGWIGWLPSRSLEWCTTAAADMHSTNALRSMLYSRCVEWAAHSSWMLSYVNVVQVCMRNKAFVRNGNNHSRADRDQRMTATGSETVALSENWILASSVSGTCDRNMGGGEYLVFVQTLHAYSYIRHPCVR